RCAFPMHERRLTGLPNDMDPLAPALRAHDRCRALRRRLGFVAMLVALAEQAFTDIAAAVVRTERTDTPCPTAPHFRHAVSAPISCALVQDVPNHDRRSAAVFVA